MADKVVKLKSGRLEKITLNESPLPVESIEW
jgi:hypothetical protein